MFDTAFTPGWLALETQQTLLKFPGAQENLTVKLQRSLIKAMGMEKQVQILCLDNSVLINISRYMQCNVVIGSELFMVGIEEGGMDGSLVIAKRSCHPLATESPCTYAHIATELWRRDENENSSGKCMGRNALNGSCRKSSKCYHPPSLHLIFSPVLDVKHTIKC